MASFVVVLTHRGKYCSLKSPMMPGQPEEKANAPFELLLHISCWQYSTVQNCLAGLKNRTFKENNGYIDPWLEASLWIIFRDIRNQIITWTSSTAFMMPWAKHASKKFEKNYFAKWQMSRVSMGVHDKLSPPSKRVVIYWLRETNSGHKAYEKSPRMNATWALFTDAINSWHDAPNRLLSGMQKKTCSFIQS